MANPGTKRSRQLKVTMTPDVHTRLVYLADKLGQTPATLASVAISLYIAQQETALGATDRAIDKMTAHLGPEFAAQLRLLGAAEE